MDIDLGTPDCGGGEKSTASVIRLVGNSPAPQFSITTGSVYLSEVYDGVIVGEETGVVGLRPINPGRN